ncbi:hypothetical protein ACYTPF_16775 [Alteromonas sp. HB246098]
MKIVVVGTSNSVIGNKGFIQSLRLQHEVIQLSCGRVPFFYHLKTLIKNRELVENCDLLILDHYINDVNVYRGILSDEYQHLCEEFYKFLSTLNVNIVNVFFPVIGLRDYKFNSFYDTVLELCHLNSISVIDLNELNFSKGHFKDKIHLSHRTSYFFGIILGGVLASHEYRLKRNRPSGGQCKNNPFSIVNIPEVVGNSTEFKNDLIHIEYAEIKKEFCVKCDVRNKLLAIGYFGLKGAEGSPGCVINKKHKIALSGYGYFFEALDFDSYGDVVISPFFSDSDCLDTLMKRGKVDGPFTYLYLVDLLFYNGEQLEYTSANRVVFNFDVSNLIELSSVFDKFYSFPSLSAKSIDLIRDAAVSMEVEDTIIARELMLLASIARPNGPFIKRKLEEYNSLIE